MRPHGKAARSEMRLRAIRWRHVKVPLKARIRHASHEREASDNLIVSVTLEGGATGHGEGVPRPYVTGETIESTFGVLESAPWDGLRESPRDFADAVAKIVPFELAPEGPDPRGMRANAARCALEMAWIDAHARAFGLPFHAALDHLPHQAIAVQPAPSPVRYSGAVTAADPRRERISAWKMRLYGFHQVKVKVGVEGQDDARRLARFRRILGRKCDIRIDANEAWSPDGLVERVRPLLASGPSALEQPVPHADAEALAVLRPRLGIPVMLDESLCSEADGRRAIELGLADIFNVRLSKCGGVARSLALMEMAARAGLGVQLGCHPGETGILSAAGRHVASRIRGIRYLEGSYDRHVLQSNVIREDITFRYGGRAAPLSGPGLGVTIDPDALDALTIQHREVCFD